MKINILLIALFATICLGFSACSPRVTTQSFGNTMTNIDDPENIVVYGLEEEIPANAKVIAEVDVDNQFYTFNCAYNQVLQLVLQQAYKEGGNAIKITSHKRPDMLHTCHRLKAVVLNAPLPGSLTIYKDTARTEEYVDDGYRKINDVERFSAPRFRWAVNANWSYLTAKTDKNASPQDANYANKLRDALGLGTEFAYYYKKNYGVGVLYSFRHNTASAEGGSLTLHYVAPTYNVRCIFGVKNNHHLLFNAGIGYLGYRYKLDGTTLGSLVKANALGSSLSVGYDYLISNSIAIGVGVQYIAGSFRWAGVKNLGSGNTSTMKLPERASLNRVELSLGIRFLK